LLQATTGTGEPAAGADTWWSFQPVNPPTLPHVANPRWVQTPVDSFILARMEAAHLGPAPRADRRTLLRRVTFDLTGLPPTPEEITSFLADASPRAFENVVERLLASPRYGERWGRHWMDVVRYADTAGDNADYPVPEARLYRDYIIDAFNADKPYDQFVCEQLAGDLIAREGPAERAAERIVATGFLALSRRYATAPFELMHLTVEDAIETTGRAFLGMTPRCARCHDHKYDPLTRTDYYGMYGFFASTRFPYAGSEEFQSKNLPRTGFVPLMAEEAGARELEANRRRVAELKVAVSQAEAEAARARTNAGARTEDGARLAALRLELKQRERLGHAPGLPVAYGVTDDRPVDQAIHLRGDPATPGTVVPRCLPRFLAGGTPLAIKPGTSGRLEFARWIADPANPLTARVMVNRIWQHHFGRGLVGTPSNFGLRGETPTHPELLDYLADAFVRGGWSVKAMHRLILNSATWQQSDTPADPALDPANRLYTRFDRQRLDAESIRDAMLMVSGTLDLSRPGAHPFPPVEDWHWTQHNPFKAVYESRHRSVYLMRQRLQRHPYLALFDAPDANTPVDVRTHATVPPQSLYLMNSPFVAEQADAFAHRAAAESTEGRGRAARMVLLAWGRPPTPVELRAATRYIEQFTTEARREGVTPEDADREAWRSYGRVLLGSNEFLYID
jgi:hypothetical protein